MTPAPRLLAITQGGSAILQKSLSRSGPLNNPPDILIVADRIIVTNVLQRARQTPCGSGIQPLVRFNMTVGKSNHTHLVMQGRGIMDYPLQIHIDTETRRADVARINVHEREAVGRRIYVDLGSFHVNPVSRT